MSTLSRHKHALQGQRAVAAVLFIPAFIFTVLSLTSSRWATSAVFVSPDGSQSAATAQFAATNFRGPFHSTYFSFVQNPATGNFTNHTAGASTICVDGEFDFIGNQSQPNFFCQQLRIGTTTLMAGSALTGLSMLLAIAAFGTAFTTSTKAQTSEAVLQKALLLLGALAAGCQAFGGLVVANTLINLQRPDGDSITDVPLNPLQHHWKAGVGCVYVGTAVVLLVIGLVMIPSSIGEMHMQRERSHHVEGHGYKD